MEIGSNLIPYVGPEEFRRLISQEELESTAVVKSVLSRKFIFSGRYGHDLINEVSRYALIASALASQNTFDVIHSHDWLTFPAGIAAKEVSGRPLVVHIHATEFDRTGGNVNQNVYEIERLGMEYADRVITVSNLTRQMVIDRYGIDPAKVVTVHNAVEPLHRSGSVDFIKSFPEKVVTFLGRITFQKGPDYFIEAAGKVLKADENVRFVMAGTGDMMNRMIHRVAELRIGHKFNFTGFLKGNDVESMFSLSDILVMPSVSEPFGIVPLEAMQSNVPVIISRQSGVAEILHHAIKIDFWDVDALADAIYGLLNYNGVTELFKKFGKIEVESLKWEDAAQKVTNIYKEVVY